jgi:hypothetical protein
MKYRIAMWAGTGFLVASFWAIYAFAMRPLPMSSTAPLLWTFINLTCPILLAGFYFHFGVHLYWVLLTNIAAYALLGLFFEALKQRLTPAKNFQAPTINQQAALTSLPAIE